jgi:hypothetical protein
LNTPEEIGDEPWNNGYVLATETAGLLKRLQTQPMSDDEIARSFLDLAALQSEFDVGYDARTEDKLMMGLLEFFASRGRSPAFGEVIKELKDEEEKWKQTVDLGKVPAEVSLDACRRARHIITYAVENGWMERTSDSRWRITEIGLERLEEGYFSIR